MSLHETPWLFWALVTLLLLERAYELVLNRRNVKWLQGQGALRLPQDGFGGILAAQVAWFAALGAETLYSTTTGARLWAGTLPGLLLFAGAQTLRYWCVATLGRRWSIFVFTLPHRPLVTRGPYRWMRHPNYVGVFLEMVAVPLVFGLWYSTILGALAGGAALLHRVRREEQALGPLRAAAAA